MPLSIYRPSVLLLSFQLQQDANGATGTGKAADLWEKVKDLEESFKIPDVYPLTIPNVYPPFLSLQEIDKELDEIIPDDSGFSYLPDEQRPAGQNKFFTIRTNPLRSNNTNILALSLDWQSSNPAITDDFSKFNYNKCLLPEKLEPSLGQTIILYVQPTGNPSQDRELADACVKGFGLDPLKLNCTGGSLLGSPIYSYRNQKSSPREFIHLWVWIDRTTTELDPDRRTTNLHEKNYYPLIQLLLSYHKIRFIAHKARETNTKARKIQESLETSNHYYLKPQLISKDIVSSSSSSIEPSTLTIVPSTNHLNILEQRLQEIPTQAVQYSLCLQYLDEHLITLDINHANFQLYLEQFQKVSDLYQLQDRLTFFTNFSDREYPSIYQQIKIYRSYLNTGEKQFELVTNALRGIVEIEQTRISKKLDDSIKYATIGVAVAATVATAISGEKIEWDKPASVFLVPMGIKLIVSAILGLLLVCIAQYLWRDKSHKKPPSKK